MADSALFIGWGQVVRGREAAAVEVFNEAVQYYAGLQQDGTIESVEPWFLAPHGGDLDGFFLLRGEREQLDAVKRSPDFERVSTRASLVVDGFGVVDGYTGQELGRLMGVFQEASADIGG